MTNDDGSGPLAVPLEATEEPVATVPSTNPGTELGTEPAADPVEPRASFAGVGACQDLAASPWAPVPHGPDPVAVRSRQLPDYIAGDGGTPLDEITEFPTQRQYGVEGWSGDISARLQEPAPNAPPV